MLDSMMVIDDVKNNQSIFCVTGSSMGQGMQIHKDTNEELDVIPIVIYRAFRPARGTITEEDVILMFPNAVRVMATGLGMVRSALGDENSELMQMITHTVLGALMEKLDLTPEELSDYLDTTDGEGY